MQEDSELLAHLHTQQTAVTLLGPLTRACEEAQENHRSFEREVLTNGFGPRSNGIARTLYENFVEAVTITRTTEIADVPWRFVREVAISLNNDSQSPKAATAVINGLVAFSNTLRPSAEMTALLQNDNETCEKNIIQADLARSLSSGRLATAERFLGKLIAIEKDPTESAALQRVKAAVAAKRHSKMIKTGVWFAVAAAVILLAASNQNTRSPYSPSSIQGPLSGSQVSDDIGEDRPAIGTNLNFSRANIRYCLFQDVRLQALRSLVVQEADITAFNALVDDWNSRCSKYLYRPSDKTAVDLEIDARRASLEAEGRAIALNWRPQ